MSGLLNPFVIGAAGGGGATAIRGANVETFNASTYNLPLPAGSAEGDRAVLFAGHGWGANNPAGWTVLNNATGLNWNGGAWTKLLSATDISNGYVTVSFAGSFNGVLGVIVFEGATSGVRADEFERNSNASLTRDITILSSEGIQAGDYAISWGSKRQNTTVTSDTGTQLDSAAGTNACCVLNGGDLASGGELTVTFTYGSTTASGDYQAVVVIIP